MGLGVGCKRGQSVRRKQTSRRSFHSDELTELVGAGVGTEVGGGVGDGVGSDDGGSVVGKFVGLFVGGAVGGACGPNSIAIVADPTGLSDVSISWTLIRRSYPVFLQFERRACLPCVKVDLRLLVE